MQRNTTWKRRLAKAGKALLRNGPQTALTLTVALALEAYGWGYIWMTNTGTVEVAGIVIRLALIESIVISVFGLLAVVAGVIASEARQDPRPEVRRTAGYTQLLAMALLAVPMLKAADGFAYGKQLEAYRAYIVSPQFAVDRRQASDVTLDSMAQRDAAASLDRATRPVRATFDFECFAYALMLYGLNLAASSLLRRPRPETPAEAQRRERADRAAKAAATRAANAKAKADLERKLARKAKAPNVVRLLREGKA